MKKYKEAMEKRSVYSADSFLLAYKFTYGQADHVNTEKFTMPGTFCGDILRPQHALPSDRFLAMLPEDFR